MFLSTPTVVKTFADLRSVISNHQSRDQSQVTCDYTNPAITCIPYFEFIIHSSGTSVTVSRTYKGDLESFGDFGGFKKVIILAITFIYSFYHGRSQMKFMINKLYDVEQKNKEYIEIITGKTPDSMTPKQKKNQRKRLSRLQRTQ